MEEINIREFAKLFSDEINKSNTVQRYIGKVSPKDIWLIHKPFTYRVFEFLYSHYPSKLKFGEYFYLYSKPQRDIDIDARKRKENKPRKPKSNKKTSKLWSKHVNINASS